MIGERIKTARKKLHLTQAELAEIVGISRNSLSRIETNEDVVNMTVYTAVRIAKALRMTLDFLIYGEC